MESTSLQWGHRLSAMETRTAAGWASPTASAFNGATAFRRWKPGRPLAGQVPRHLPSMGPPPFGDGNGCANLARLRDGRILQWGHRLSAMETGHWALPWASAPHAFNGATAFRRWKLAVRKRLRIPCSTFNGATAFRRWKRDVEQAAHDDHGRTFNGATAFRRWKLPGWCASTGTTTRTFNGATAFRRWKRRPLSPIQGFATQPSMGPPPFGDGNGAPPEINSGAKVFLQWSHRLSAMETEPRRKSIPVQKSSFNGATAFRRWKPGPPPAGSGTTPAPFNGATAFRRWKLPSAVVEFPNVIHLQWGHRLSAMETPPSATVSPAGWTTFNGATAFRRWKLLGPRLSG